MSVIIPHAHQGIFRLAAELRVQEKAEQVRPLESWPEPGQLHFASFYWPKQVASPVQLQKLEKQTPPPDGSSCKVSMQRDMYTGRAGDRRPSFYHWFISQNWNCQNEGCALRWLPACLPSFPPPPPPSLSFFVRFTRSHNKERPWKWVLGNSVRTNHFAVPTISFNLHSWLW